MKWMIWTSGDELIYYKCGYVNSKTRLLSKVAKDRPYANEEQSYFYLFLN
jgi:hypothetical protein